MAKTVVFLKKSNRPDKKFMVFVDGKTIHFGAAGMSDYTKHKDYERMQRYNIRHKKRENWGKSGIKTAGFWSKWILWNKPSFEASKKNIASRFNISFKKGWPTAKTSLRKSRKAKSTRKSPTAKTSLRKSRKAKSTHKSPRAKMSLRKSRKAKKSVRKSRKVLSKYERCVLAVKSKQPKHCMKDGKWVGGEKCYNPYAVCRAKIKD
jgi:hypothetical protein